MQKGNSQNTHPILTVIGADKKGIVAQISSLLWEKKINIEEIQQGIMKGNFFMVMSIDISDAVATFGEIAGELERLGGKIGVKINMYDQEIFDTMHKI